MKKKIAILNVFGDDDPIYRMKILPLIKCKSEKYSFTSLQADSGSIDGLILRLNLDQAIPQEIVTIIASKFSQTVVMLLLPDLELKHLHALRQIQSLVDIILVPTPEIQHLARSLTDIKVEVLIDPIDFCSDRSENKPSHNNFTDLPMKVVWFGFPESFNKSMSGHINTIEQLVKNNEIEFHIITKNTSYGKIGFATVHEYQSKNFLQLLKLFDMCMLSHTPFDFSVSTFSKSENKAILAINQGLPVVASRTPAYERLMTLCQTRDYLFSSSAELTSKIRLLKLGRNRLNYLETSQDIVLKHYSSKKMANDWDVIYSAQGE